MERLLLMIPLAVVIALVIRSKKRKKPEKSGWHIEWSPGMETRPTPDTTGEGEWYFYFPKTPISHVHYVQWFQPPSLVKAKEIYVKFEVVGGHFIPQEFPDREALVSLLIQREGDDWGAIGPMQSYRWYSNKTVKLETGVFEMTIPLTVDHWGDVRGGKDPDMFDAALDHAGNIGLVFGSAGGRGHGVYATEISRFRLLEMEVR